LAGNGGDAGGGGIYMVSGTLSLGQATSIRGNTVEAGDAGAGGNGGNGGLGGNGAAAGGSFPAGRGGNGGNGANAGIGGNGGYAIAGGIYLGTGKLNHRNEYRHQQQQCSWRGLAGLVEPVELVAMAGIQATRQPQRATVGWAAMAAMPAIRSMPSVAVSM
jgi:hypothetical protein